MKIQIKAGRFPSVTGREFPNREWVSNDTADHRVLYLQLTTAHSTQTTWKTVQVPPKYVTWCLLSCSWRYEICKRSTFQASFSSFMASWEASTGNRSTLSRRFCHETNSHLFFKEIMAKLWNIFQVDNGKLEGAYFLILEVFNRTSRFDWILSTNYSLSYRLTQSRPGALCFASISLRLAVSETDDACSSVVDYSRREIGVINNHSDWLGWFRFLVPRSAWIGHGRQMRWKMQPSTPTVFGVLRANVAFGSPHNWDASESSDVAILFITGIWGKYETYYSVTAKLAIILGQNVPKTERSHHFCD